ncbi:hypothetical protein JY651_02145 [Pyxidicoccus parkwayensis]|uniref:Uncharacterized protein n=1 Tax=Pyxidicoccus parkwayensis TaxID=2813578 RepID=A0ABX7NYL8_9BACT|nr:hypothetical protein [Pyxidicoccus parkwaysis]QSQ23808.1 hypothetical protein JY651_02145 [Pyxidicoccus parkwaysis]
MLVASCLLSSLLQGLPLMTAEDVVATSLLDAGEEPRRALVLMHRPGWAQRARLSVASEVETVSGEGSAGELRTEYGPEVVVPLHLDLPVTSMDGGARFRTGPGRLVPPDPWATRQTARYRLRVGQPEVRAADDGGEEHALKLAQFLTGMSGRQGEVVLSSTGALVEAWMDLRGGMPSVLTVLMRGALSSDWLATPQFPEEPVGPGARWTVARAHGVGGMSVITYELVELRGPHGRLKFQLHAKRPGGAREPVAEGELRFDLRRPLPERMEALFTSRDSPGAREGRRREVVRRTRVTLEAGGLQPALQRTRVAVPP